MKKRAQLNAVLRDLEVTAGSSALEAAIVTLRDVLGVDHLVYRWVGPDRDILILGSFPRAWPVIYAQQHYRHADPVLASCLRNPRAINWKQLDWSGKAARRLLGDTIAHGMGPQGYSVPLRGPNGQIAMLTCHDACSDDAWARFIADHRNDLLVTGHAINCQARDCAPDRVPPARSLSPREVDAMTLLAHGYTRAQAAQSLAISEHTLRVHLENARQKLAALNSTHAVARALTCGLIVL